MNEDSTELDQLFVNLRKLKPVPKRLQVMCTDGDTRNIPVPPSRQKWQKLRPKIGALDWIRVEAYDSKGQFQDGFESGIDVELEDLDGSTTARDIAFYNAVARQVKLNQESVKDALGEQAKQSKVLLEGAAKCVEVTTQAVAALQRIYETRIKVLDAMVDEAGDEGGLLSGKFLEVMGSEIAKQAAPQIVSKVLSKKNGRRANK